MITYKYDYEKHRVTGLSLYDMTDRDGVVWVNGNSYCVVEFNDNELLICSVNGKGELRWPVTSNDKLFYSLNVRLGLI